AGHNRNHTMIAVGEYVDVFGHRMCDQVKAEWFVKDDFEIQRFRIDSVTLSAFWEYLRCRESSKIPARSLLKLPEQKPCQSLRPWMCP
ncbi:unnamed protein product, partial [Aphanomyces euteiches]